MDGTSRFNSVLFEDNALTILDNSWSKHSAQDAHDDRTAFLKAVRDASLVPENGIAPTYKIFEGIFNILRTGDSLDLYIASYHLLSELDKRYPRVYLTGVEQPKSSSSSIDIVVTEEAWSPFVVGSDTGNSERGAAKKNTNGRLDSSLIQAEWHLFFGRALILAKSGSGTIATARLESGFYHLIQDLAEVVNEADLVTSNAKVRLVLCLLNVLGRKGESVNNQMVQNVLVWFKKKGLKKILSELLGNMLLLQYIVSALEGDFLPRNSVYKETMDWILVRESLLNLLLSSRRINYKNLMRDCVSLMCRLHSQVQGFSDNLDSSENSTKTYPNYDETVAISLLEFGKGTCAAIEKLLLLIMDLDVSRKEADMEGHTTRADGVRTPLLDVILDELTYDETLLSSFLQVVSEPKRKLEIVLMYFWKYHTKPSVQTRRSNVSSNEKTFGELLKCFSNTTTTKSIVKKVGTEVVQLLISHGFQAHLPLFLEGHSEEEVTNCSLEDLCKNTIFAFKNLRKTHQHMELVPFGKEALFTATSILSAKCK